jgi:AraC-like DNA-binding protein
MLFREQRSQHLYRVWHEDWYAFCVVEAGVGQIRYRGRTLGVEPGRVLGFAPGNVHETRRIELPATYWVLLVPVKDLAVRSGHSGELEWDAAPWTEPYLVEQFRAVCCALANPKTPLIDRELSYAALLDLIVAQDRRAKGTLPCRIERAVVRRVQEHLVSQLLTCDVQLAGVASALGWSPGYVSKAFSTVGACPPKTLLRLVRVERARRHLELPGEASIKQAALIAGFSTAEKFNHAFRVAWNLSPTEYRELHRRAPQSQSGVEPGPQRLKS